MVNATTNPLPTNQTESCASDVFNDGKDFSSAVRVFNGIFIALSFTIGLWANLLVLHVLRKGRTLLKNTSVILANIMITDLFCMLLVLPYDFIRYALDTSLPQDNAIFKTISAFKNGLMFLNCGLTMTLTVERTKTATYFGKRRGNHLSRPLTLCLGAIWLSSLGEAMLTYKTFNVSEMLPWKRSVRSSRTFPVGDTIIMVIVLATNLVIIVSLYLIRRFLRSLNGETEMTFRWNSRRKKMHKRITLAWFVSLATLVVSYLPFITVSLIWGSLGRQNSDANAIVQVLCSFTHTINPVVAIAMSCRLQRAFLRAIKFVEPFKTLSKRFPSYYGSGTSLSGENVILGNKTANGGSLRLPRTPLEQNVYNTNFNWTVQQADDEAFGGNIAIQVISELSGNESSNDHVTQVEKKPLIKPRSSSVGDRLAVPQENPSLLGKPTCVLNRSDSKIYITVKPPDE